MEERRGFTGSQLTVAFLGGALAGAAIAILAAPQSGQETREQLSDYVRRRRQRKAAGIPKSVDSDFGEGMDANALDVSVR